MLLFDKEVIISVSVVMFIENDYDFDRFWSLFLTYVSLQAKYKYFNRLVLQYDKINVILFN